MFTKMVSGPMRENASASIMPMVSGRLPYVYRDDIGPFIQSVQIDELQPYFCGEIIVRMKRPGDELHSDPGGDAGRLSPMAPSPMRPSVFSVQLRHLSPWPLAGPHGGIVSGYLARRRHHEGQGVFGHGKRRPRPACSIR